MHGKGTLRDVKGRFFMTIGALIVLAVLGVLYIFLGIMIAGSWLNMEHHIQGGIVIGLVLTLITLLVMIWYFNGTESGKRALKTQESELHALSRVVTVYDVDGHVVKEYKGKFDIEYNDNRIIFDDENGLRHIIFLKTGTVTIDETGG